MLPYFKCTSNNHAECITSACFWRSRWHDVENSLYMIINPNKQQCNIVSISFFKNISSRKSMRLFTSLNLLQCSLRISNVIPYTDNTLYSYRWFFRYVCLDFSILVSLFSGYSLPVQWLSYFFPVQNAYLEVCSSNVTCAGEWNT